jgi:hypothetical protein
MKAIFGSWIARLAIFAVLFGAFLILGGRLSMIAASIWAIVFGAAMSIAIGTLRLGATARRDRRLVEQAHALRSPRHGEVIAVCGTIEPEGEPMMAPIGGQPSVAYLYSAYHKVLSTAGRRRDYKRVVDYAGYGIAPARVCGSNFTARLGGFPHLHDFGGEIRATEARTRIAEYLRFAKFDPVPEGEMIEWVSLMEKDWDGRGGARRRDFRRQAGYDPSSCTLTEESVPPGAKACAIGVWSSARNALVAGNDQDLWLYEGSPEKVRDVLKTSSGCSVVIASLLIAGSLATAIYLVLP